MTLPHYTRAQELPAILEQRIAILDGAMGTMIQRFKLTEAQYRGERFADFARDVKGNNELLSLTRPDVIRDIHEGYLAAGADLIETNTFGATSIAQDDYAMGDLAYEMNLESAKLARAACDKFSTPDKPRFVAGALGPTPKTASISPDVNDPGARNISFEQLRAAYLEQTLALIEGGADVILVETIFDTLNAKAALFAVDEAFEQTGECLPIMISGTVTDASGRILSGQTVTAFWHSVRHANPLSIGLNCALGAALMRPYIQELAKAAPDTFISCYPNAGLPNPMSDTGFDETPEVTSRLVHEFAAEGLVNILGGCCGTTPDHISAIARAVAPVGTRKLFQSWTPPINHAQLLADEAQYCSFGDTVHYVNPPEDLHRLDVRLRGRLPRAHAGRVQHHQQLPLPPPPQGHDDRGVFGAIVREARKFENDTLWPQPGNAVAAFRRAHPGRLCRAAGHSSRV